MSTELSVEESILLWDAVLGQINSQFELWLTITFAVIIASYVAGTKLSRIQQYMVATLYVLVSALLMAMMIGAVLFAGRYEAFGIFADPTPAEWVVAALRSTVWVLGSITTVVFIFVGRRDD